MGAAARYGQPLRATLCEVERGVFYATYTDFESASVAAELTSYQIGTSAADVRQKIDQRARALGYEGVIWTETVVAPLFASDIKSELHDLSPPHAAGLDA